MAIDLEETFEKYESVDIGDFHLIENPPHKNRPDLCAFLLLDRLVPGTFDMVEAASHDQIWLSIDCGKLAEAATEEDIRTLRICGVWYDPARDMLSMFV